MIKKIITNTYFKHALVAFLLALLILFIGFKWLKSYTNHGEKIETPNFIGLQIEDANKLAELKKLDLVVDSVYSATAQKGKIILQSPPAYTDSTHSWVKPYRKIYLTMVRSDVQMLEIPNIDASEMVVIPRLEGRFKIKKHYEAGPTGKVLSVVYQNKKVKQGDLIPRGANIVVNIGEEKQKHPIELPNLVGLTIGEAQLELSGKELSLVELFNNCVTKLDSAQVKIAQQSPAYHEGAKILQGSEIIIQLNCPSME